MSVEFEEAAELLAADPEASTLCVSGSDTPTTAGGGRGEDVKLDLSEDEEGQEESSEVNKLSVLTCHHNTGEGC